MTEWMTRAVCADQPDWLDRPHDAQLVDCSGCPVGRRCLEFAIATRATGVTMGGVVIGKLPIRWAADQAGAGEPL